MLWYGRLRCCGGDSTIVTTSLLHPGPAYIKSYQWKSAQQHMGAKPGPRRRTTEGGVKYTLPRPIYMCLYCMFVHTAVIVIQDPCLVNNPFARPLAGHQLGSTGSTIQLNGYIICRVGPYEPYDSDPWRLGHVYRL